MKKLKAKKNKFLNYDGFSFIESMLAVAVLAIGIVAAISLITSSLRNAADSRDQLIATLLAQEGVELAQNIRDTNWATDADFLNTFSNSENCRLDYTMTSASSCQATPPANYFSLGFSNYYTHTNNQQKFLRKISYLIQGSSPNRTIKVTSQVTWGGSESFLKTSTDAPTQCHSSGKCVLTQVTLTEWQQ